MSAREFDHLAFHAEAVKIDSTEDVEEMRDLLVSTLSDAGITPTVDDAGNVIATREGEAEGPHLVLNTHIDTVPPPIPYERDGDVVRGRGSCDAKGPLASLLAAFFAVDPERGKVTLAVTPDEETLSTGAAALSLDADGYIVGEPTGLDVCTAAKGRFQGTVTIHGESAHAAEPGSGTSAIRAAADAIEALDTFDDTHGPGVHAALGAPTLTATTITGGDATNQVPETCEIVVDRRSVPPETAEGYRSALESHLRASVSDDVGLDFHLTDRESPFLEAFATDEAERLVTTLRDASGGEVRPFSAATEASYFAEDAPTVVFGPGVLADSDGAVAHSPREYVERPDVTAAADAVEETLRAFLA